MVETAISRERTRMTADEFFNFCQLPEMRDKRIERTKTGKIIIMEPTGGTTGSFNSEVHTEVNLWNRSTHSGRTFDSSTGFTLPNTAVKSADNASIYIVPMVAAKKWILLRKRFRAKMS